MNLILDNSDNNEDADEDEDDGNIRNKRRRLKKSSTTTTRVPCSSSSSSKIFSFITSWISFHQGNNNHNNNSNTDSKTVQNLSLSKLFSQWYDRISSTDASPLQAMKAIHAALAALIRIIYVHTSYRIQMTATGTLTTATTIHSDDTGTGQDTIVVAEDLLQRAIHISHSFLQMNFIQSNKTAAVVMSDSSGSTSTTTQRATALTKQATGGGGSTNRGVRVKVDTSISRGITEVVCCDHVLYILCLHILTYIAYIYYI